MGGWVVRVPGVEHRTGVVHRTGVEHGAGVEYKAWPRVKVVEG